MQHIGYGCVDLRWGLIRMDGQQLFNIAVSVCGVAGIPLLTFFWNRIKEAKEEGMRQAAIAIAEVQKIADEGKKLAIEAKKDLGELKVHIAENYISVKRFEGFETALFKKLDSIEGKLDKKADKA